MKKILIPKDNASDVQEYTIIDEIQQGPRKIKVARIVSKALLVAEKTKLEKDQNDIKDKIKNLDDLIKDME